MSKSAKKDQPKLWQEIVDHIKMANAYGTAAGKWSARKAQAAVKAYKEAGGGYLDDKTSSNSLAKWTKQKWRTKSGGKSSETGERYLPEKAIEALTDEEYEQTSAKKRKDTKAGKSVSKQPKEIAKKVRKYRQ